MYNFEQIQENWDKLHTKISGLTDRKITTLAVTKAHPIELWEICHNLGIRDIGENRIQELREKKESRPDLRETFNVHFIGALQNNKVKYLDTNVDTFDTLQTMDAVGIIDRRWSSSQPLRVLLQINATGETQKAGLMMKSEDAITELLQACISFGNIHPEGFLAMGPTPTNNYNMDSSDYREDTKKAFLSVVDVRIITNSSPPNRNNKSVSLKVFFISCDNSSNTSSP